MTIDAAFIGVIIRPGLGPRFVLVSLAFYGDPDRDMIIRSEAMVT